MSTPVSSSEAQASIVLPVTILDIFVTAAESVLPSWSSAAPPVYQKIEKKNAVAKPNIKQSQKSLKLLKILQKLKSYSACVK